jgi:uncharacterized protein YbaP (TraB family)
VIRGLLALAALLSLSACGETARDWPEPSPALWEVSGRNGEKAWLFGTIHALPEGVQWRTAAFDAAFAEADVLLVEIGDLGNSGAAAEAFDRFAKSQGLPALSSRVARGDRPALEALMERAGMDDADFRDTETWAAALLLGNAVRESDPANGVDRDLLDEGRPVEGLETFTGQFARFDALDEPAQRALLAAVAREARLDDGEERVIAWLVGDVNGLAGQVDSSLAASPVLRQELVMERNELFAARIVAAIEGRREPFVAVGAGHMLGPDGLPALLAARGYTVTRVQ